MKEEEKEKNVLKRISYSSQVEANSGLKIKEFSRSEGIFFPSFNDDIWAF